MKRSLTLFSASLLLCAQSYAQYQHVWKQVGTGANALNANNLINSISCDAAGNIYAAGVFKDSNNKTYVAKWDGTSWSELGVNGLNSHFPVYATAVDASSNVYAAVYKSVEKWDGTSWSVLHTFNNQVHTLAVDTSGNVYAAGTFTSATGKGYVAEWDGTSWTELDASTDSLNANSDIKTIAVDASGNVYAGGSFTDTSGNTYVAKWNGTSWSELGAGANALISGQNAINSVYVDQAGNVYTAGEFSNSNINGYVAKWNGTTWTEVGAGPSTAIDLAVGINVIGGDQAGNLYTGGFYVDANQNAYTAKWDGSSWSELGGTTLAHQDQQTYTLCVDPFGDVYIAGQLQDTAGNYYVAEYARITADSVVVTTQNNAPDTIDLNINATLQMEATVYPLTDTQQVAWSIVPGTGTATISASGLVTGQTVGTVWAKAMSVVDSLEMDSVEITIINSATNGVKEVAANAGMRIYPNPATNALTIEVAKQPANNAMIYVYNIAGALVKEQAMSGKNMTLDVSSIEPGIYTIKYVNSGDNTVAKFTKY